MAPICRTGRDVSLLLDISHVTKTFPGPNARPVLRGVSLTLGAGQTLALTGESGSGKSTLLHLAGALDSFDSGEIRIEGTALSTLGDTGRAALRRDCVALVFQQFNLIPSLNVAQNLAFHARLGGIADPDWLAVLTDRLGLADVARLLPGALSIGQRQRTAIARSLAHRPPFVIADEPTAALDPDSADAVLALLLEVAAGQGCGVILSSHDVARIDRFGIERLSLHVQSEGGRVVSTLEEGAPC